MGKPNDVYFRRIPNENMVWVAYFGVQSDSPPIKELVAPVLAEALKPTEVFVAYSSRNSPFALITLADGQADPRRSGGRSVFLLAKPYDQKLLDHYLTRTRDVKDRPLNCHMVLATNDLDELVLNDIRSLGFHPIDVVD